MYNTMAVLMYMKTIMVVVALKLMVLYYSTNLIFFRALADFTKDLKSQAIILAYGDNSDTNFTNNEIEKLSSMFAILRDALDTRIDSLGLDHIIIY